MRRGHSEHEVTVRRGHSEDEVTLILRSHVGLGMLRSEDAGGHGSLLVDQVMSLLTCIMVLVANLRLCTF